MNYTTHLHVFQWCPSPSLPRSSDELPQVRGLELSLQNEGISVIFLARKWSCNKDCTSRITWQRDLPLWNQENPISISSVTYQNWKLIIDSGRSIFNSAYNILNEKLMQDANFDGDFLLWQPIFDFDNSVENCKLHIKFQFHVWKMKLKIEFRILKLNIQYYIKN